MRKRSQIMYKPNTLNQIQKILRKYNLITSVLNYTLQAY